MKTSLGNIKSSTLKNIINNQKYNEMINIKKDEIQVCKDCEFRYACVDCRAFTLNEEKLSKPSKCTYNPYTTSWGIKSMLLGLIVILLSNCSFNEKILIKHKMETYFNQDQEIAWMILFKTTNKKTIDSLNALPFEKKLLKIRNIQSQKTKFDSFNLITLRNQQHQIDSQLFNTLKYSFHKFGFPKFVDKKCINLVLLHCNVDSINNLLPLIKYYVSQKKITPNIYAIAFDRVLTEHNLPSYYLSNLSKDSINTLLVKNKSLIRQVNIKRIEIDLDTIN